MTGPASFHVLRDASAVHAIVRLVGDRRWARRRHGAEFIRVLGTSRGASTAWSSDPRRTAVFAVWSSDDALASFVAAGATGHRPRQVGAQHYGLRLVSGHGDWGTNVLDRISPADPASSGEVAVITRASVRLRNWPSFVRQARAVSTAAVGQPGLIDLLGFGEAPIARLGTFSRWQSPSHAESFHRTDAAHRAASRRAGDGDWFRTQLFARFVVDCYSSTGAESAGT